MSDKVNLQSLFAESGLKEVLDQLDAELVGLAPVKKRIREIAAFLLLQKVREERGIDNQKPTLHMNFTGNPGTGKTTVAMRMATILYKLGYIDTDNLVAVTRDDLVGQYIGHTAPKTKEVMKKAMGGVLFIDEAYYLYRPENEKDYGQETIEILLQMMENERAKLVVIFAGYKEKMDKFFTSNPGLKSRISHHIDFPDYTEEELMEIAHLLINQKMYKIDSETEKTLKEYIGIRKTQEYFANARSIRNAVERAIFRQAGRLLETGQTLELDDLKSLKPEDFLQSSVFNNKQSG